MTDMIPYGQDPPSFLRDAQHWSAEGYAHLLGVIFAPSKDAREYHLQGADFCFLVADRNLKFSEMGP